MRRVDYENLPSILREYSDYAEVRYSQDTLERRLYLLVDVDDFLVQNRGHGIDRLTSDDNLAYIAEMQRRRDKEHRISDNSIKVHLSIALKQYAKWLCKRKKLLDFDEFELICEDIHDLPFDAAEIGKDRQALKGEEKSTLLQRSTNLLWFMLVWTGLNWGFRRMDYVKLRIVDLGLDAEIPVIRIVRSKGRKTWEIPLHPSQVDQWREWLKYRATLKLNHDYVFYNPNKLEPLTRNALTGIFQKFSATTGVYVYPHRLRYTFAVYLYERKVPIYYISKALGHSSLGMTERYLKVPIQEFFDGYLDSTKNLF